MRVATHRRCRARRRYREVTEGLWSLLCFLMLSSQEGLLTRKAVVPEAARLRGIADVERGVSWALLFQAVPHWIFIYCQHITIHPEVPTERATSKALLLRRCAKCRSVMLVLALLLGGEVVGELVACAITSIER